MRPREWWYSQSTPWTCLANACTIYEQWVDMQNTLWPYKPEGCKNHWDGSWLCIAIFTTHCHYCENLKRQCCFHDSTLCSNIFLWSLTKYLWSEMWIVKKNHSHKLSAMADNLWLGLAADHCVAICSTCCSYLKNLKRQFYCIHSTLSYILSMWFLEQYLWWKLW